MKEITYEDIQMVEEELKMAREKFEKMNFNSLDEKLEWIKDYFNVYIPSLERRFMTEKELREWVFLPNELRIKFYQYFPEHGLNMANYSQELAKENQKARKFVNRFLI